MSDLHDNVVAWERIVWRLEKERVNTLINCGDTSAPSMLQDMARIFPGKIHTVFGNVVDRELERKVAAELMNVVHHGDRGGVELAGRRIGFVHRPTIAEAMIHGGEFDLVCHGHTHLKRWEKIGACYVLNPGTAGGMFQYPSFALVDLAKMQAQFIEVML